MLEINGNRYCKINNDNSTRFTTRLVSNGGVYSSNSATLEVNNGLLENAGLLEHANCIPFLAKTMDSHTSKSSAELRKLEILHVNILNQKENKKYQEASLTKHIEEDMLRIEEQTKPLFAEFKKEKEKLDWKNECKQFFHG